MVLVLEERIFAAGFGDAHPLVRTGVRLEGFGFAHTGV